MKITTIESNHIRLDGGAMFGNAPKAVWGKWLFADSNNQIQISCRSLLVESDDHKILVDAGPGDYMDPKLSQRYGIESGGNLLVKGLEDIGVSPADITAVILTHLHFDHAGGVLTGTEDGSRFALNFPNAIYALSEKQWERAKTPHPRDRASFIPELTELLRESKQLLCIKEGGGINGLEKLVSFIHSDGHTPGLLLPLFHDGKSNVFFISDLTPGSQWVHLPLTTGYDRYPELLVDEKKRILERAIGEQWMVIYVHDPETAASYVDINPKGRYEALSGVKHLSGQEMR